MKAINCPLRPRSVDDMLSGYPSARTRAALKKAGRKQLRAAERQLFLREEIGGMFAQLALDKAEALALAKLKAVAATRMQARAKRDVRQMLLSLQQQADEQLGMTAELRFVADRVLVEHPVRVIRKNGIQTVMVRASCAV